MKTPKIFNAMVTVFVAGLSCISVMPRAWAWGDQGHAVIGAIAEKNLSPKGKGLVRGLLGVEPLSVAATWADQVREDARFENFDAYHFLDIPGADSFDSIPVSARAERDGDIVIQMAPKVLLDNNRSREEKIIILRYLIHIVGDMHQPLHVGNGLDFGGNLCKVKWAEPGSSSAREVNLHSLWDSALVSHIANDYNRAKKSRFFTADQFAEALLKDVGPPADTEVRARPGQWYTESKRYHSLVYPDPKPTLPEDRKYCRVARRESRQVEDGVFNSKEIPTLAKEYNDRALPVVRSQLVLAGYRLAAYFNEIAKSSDVSAGAASDGEIIKKVEFTKKDLAR